MTSASAVEYNTDSLCVALGVRTLARVDITWSASRRCWEGPAWRTERPDATSMVCRYSILNGFTGGHKEHRNRATLSVDCAARERECGYAGTDYMVGARSGVCDW